MKKNLLILLIIGIISNSFSQSEEIKKIAGGLYVGTGLSWSASDIKQVERDGIKFNYGIGATMDFNFIDNFGLSMSFGFTKLGFKQKYKYGGAEFLFEEGEYEKLLSISRNSKVVNNIYNLEFPIGLKGRTNVIDIGGLPFSFFLKASVVPMITLKSLGDVTGIPKPNGIEPTTETVFTKEIITKNINRFQLGWQVGGGTEMGLTGTTNLLVEVFYMGGIFDIDKTYIYRNENLETTNPRVHLNSFGLKVGILF